MANVNGADTAKRLQELLALQADGKIRNLKQNVKIQMALGWTDPVTGKRHKEKYWHTLFLYEEYESVKYSDYDGVRWEEEWVPKIETKEGTFLCDFSLRYKFSS